MDKTLTVLGASIALALGNSASANNNPFESTSMNQGYSVSAMKIAENNCGGGKNTSGSCGGAGTGSTCNDADYKTFEAFKNSKYFNDYQNSDAYKAFMKEQASKAPATESSGATEEKSSKGGKCSAGACGG